eukprot:scaffold80593_cov19-Tisochrysis_lutea.AAC.1
MVTMVTMGGDLQPGRLADRLVAGTDEQIGSSLDAVKKVASQEYPGSKVQKAILDTPAGKALFKLYGGNKTGTNVGNTYDDANRKKMEAKIAAGWTPPPK